MKICKIMVVVVSLWICASGCSSQKALETSVEGEIPKEESILSSTSVTPKSDNPFDPLSTLIGETATFATSGGSLVEMFSPGSDSSQLRESVVLGEWLQDDGSVSYTFDLRYGCHRVPGILEHIEDMTFRWLSGIPPQGGVELDLAECPFPDDLPDMFSVFPGSEGVTLSIEEGSNTLDIEFGDFAGTFVP